MTRPSGVRPLWQQTDGGRHVGDHVGDDGDVEGIDQYGATGRADAAKQARGREPPAGAAVFEPRGRATVAFVDGREHRGREWCHGTGHTECCDDEAGQNHRPSGVVFTDTQKQKERRPNRQGTCNQEGSGPDPAREAAEKRRADGDDEW